MSFKPYVSDQSRLPELNAVPVLLGVVLGIIFGASSLYLALKVGLTVSASIPVAVLSITLFRAFSKIFGMRPASILENNIVQTAGSAGESMSFGVAATMPALMILGFDMELSRVMMVSLLGGALGILMMIPLRRALVEATHGELPFPEGTACAQVLIVGEEGGTSAKTVFLGFFIGLIYKMVNAGSRLWHEVAEIPVKFLKGSSITCEVSPELLGVGYIIGTHNSNLMVGGGILSSFVLIPAVYLFGTFAKEPLFPAVKAIPDMSPGEIWGSYILYIGAGAVATAGIISMVRSMPVIVKAAVSGLKGLKGKSKGSSGGVSRTQRDLPMNWVLGGVLGLVLLIWFIPQLHVNLLGAILIVIFGFLFVTVSSRITGEIGSSSNPISGMTVATLLITSLVFLALGWTSPIDRVAALSIAAIVCIAASNGGTTAQDLKAGFLVGATPRAQQIAILFGALSSAMVIGYTLKVLNQTSTVYTQKNLPALVYKEASSLKEREKLEGPEAKQDGNEYLVLRVTEQNTAQGELVQVPRGKYLIDETGHFRYRVDPGVNGTLATRDDGTPVQKFAAPKARLMALIIEGILAQKLPWALILIGAFLVITLELCGVQALAFAVGVYLPLATSFPIFVGGAVRGLVDKLKKKDEGDSGPGVLLSSGLIAGGSIAGIGLALAELNPRLKEAIDLESHFKMIATSGVTPVVAFLGLAGYLFYHAYTAKK